MSCAIVRRLLQFSFSSAYSFRQQTHDRLTLIDPKSQRELLPLTLPIKSRLLPFVRIRVTAKAQRLNQMRGRVLILTHQSLCASPQPSIRTVGFAIPFPLQSLNPHTFHRLSFMCSFPFCPSIFFASFLPSFLFAYPVPGFRLRGPLIRIRSPVSLIDLANRLSI